MGILNAGVDLGPLHAGVSAAGQFPAALGSIFPGASGGEVKGAAGVGVDLGGNANGGSGAGAGVNIGGDAHWGGDAGWQGQNHEGAGVGVNLGGQPGSSNHGDGDAGIGINLGGDEGVEGGIHVGGAQGEQGVGGGIDIGGEHAGAGAEGGVAAGIGVNLSPVPIMPMTAPSRPDAPQCTIHGGPAKVLYFPPAGQQGSLESINNQGGPAPPAPAAGTPYATNGQVFHPGSAYISCETLYAAYTDDKSSTIQTGPTFTNAIFPFPSSQISTQCVDAKQTDAPAFNQGQQMDFGLAGSLPSSCMNVVAPTAMAELVPEWSQYLFWNMEFQPPEQICSEGAPEPQGPAWTGPPPECSCKPTVVLPSVTDVPTSPATTAAVPGGGSSPVPTSAAILSGPIPASFGAYTATMGQNLSASSTAPAPYTGVATPGARFDRTRSTLGIGLVLVAMLVL